MQLLCAYDGSEVEYPPERELPTFLQDAGMPFVYGRTAVVQRHDAANRLPVTKTSQPRLPTMQLNLWT